MNFAFQYLCMSLYGIGDVLSRYCLCLTICYLAIQASQCICSAAVNACSKNRTLCGLAVTIISNITSIKLACLLFCFK